MTHYHNLVWITGPVDTVQALYGVFEQELSNLMLKPEAVRKSNYEKFGRYWELTHWGFIGELHIVGLDLVVPDNAEHNLDAVGVIKAHIVTADGHMEKLVNVLAAKNPRMHISFGQACAMGPGEGFAGSVSEYVYGKRQTSSYELSGPSEETRAEGGDTMWGVLRQVYTTHLPTEAVREPQWVKVLQDKIRQVSAVSKEYLLGKGKSAAEIRTKLVDSTFWRRILGKGKPSRGGEGG